MKDPGGYIGEALRGCGAIKPRKRVTAREAAARYVHGFEYAEPWAVRMAYMAGVAWAKRQAKREGK